MKVLFHHTKDKQVINLCKALGFSTEELPDFQFVPIAEGFKVLSVRQGLVDSCLAIFAEGKTLLNMNDCVFDTAGELERIRARIGKPNVLLSQFSYANWVGNPGDHSAHIKEANRKRREMEKQIGLFAPSVFIPFASFVYFSHAENFFMNEHVNRIADVYDFVTRDLHVPTNVMYPGDQWDVEVPWDSGRPIAKYKTDLDRVAAGPPQTSPTISLDNLREETSTFIGKCAKKNNRLLLNALPPAQIRISDLGLDVELSFRRGMVETKGKQLDIVLSSNSLSYCFKTDWGGETLQINGRFQVPPGGKPRRFFWIFRVPRHNGYGSSLNFRFLGHQMLQRVRGVVQS